MTSLAFLQGGPPPPFASPPPDVELVKRIDTLASYAQRNGISFVQMMAERQGGNPEFSFLHGGTGHEYYVWALYCGLNGLPLSKPPSPTTAAPAAMPPPQAAQPSSGADTSAALQGLPPEVSTGWQQVLGLLNGSRDSIRNSQAWFMACAPYAAGMAEMMLQHVLALGDYQRQLHVVYLANDILFKALSQRPEGTGPEADGVAQAFKPRLGRMLCHALAGGGQAPDAQQNLLRVVNFWGERGVYDHLLVEQLAMELMGLALPGSVSVSGSSAAAGPAAPPAAVPAAPPSAAAAAPSCQPPMQPQANDGAIPPAAAGPAGSLWDVAAAARAAAAAISKRMGGVEAPLPEAGQPPPPQQQWGAPPQPGPKEWGQSPPSQDATLQYPGQPQPPYPVEPQLPPDAYPGPPPPDSYYPSGTLPPRAYPPDGWQQPAGMPPLQQQHQPYQPPPPGTYAPPSLHHGQYPGQPGMPGLGGFIPLHGVPPPGAYLGPPDAGGFPYQPLPPGGIAPLPELAPEEPGFDPCSFPPGLIPQLVEEKLKTDPPYSPLSPLDIEAAGVPPPPKVDAYLKSRVDKFYAQMADYRPGMLYSDIEVDAPRSKRFTDRGGGSRALAGGPPLPPPVPELPHAGLGLGAGPLLFMAPVEDGSFGGGPGGTGLGYGLARQEERQQRQQEREERDQQADEAATAVGLVPGGAAAPPAESGGSGGDGGANQGSVDVFSSYRHLRSKGYHQMIITSAAKRWNPKGT